MVSVFPSSKPHSYSSFTASAAQALADNEISFQWLREPWIGRLHIPTDRSAELNEILSQSPRFGCASFETYNDEVQERLAAFSARSIQQALRSLRHPDGPAALVINGLPVGTDLGPTPCREEDTAQRCWNAKALLRWVADMMGVFAQSIPNIAGGSEFHDVNPVVGTDRPISSKGGEAALPDHTDSAANDHRPDYLALLGLRGGPSTAPPTFYTPLELAATQLDPGHLESLRQPIFFLRKPTIADLTPTENSVCGPMAVLSGPAERPEFRFHASGTKSDSAAGRRALCALRTAIIGARIPIRMKTGRLLVLSNRRGAHGRAGFQPTFATDERWLLRAYFLTDPWFHREAIVSGAIRIASPCLEQAQ